MTRDDAEIITKAIVQIQEALNKYPESENILDDRYIGIDVSTTRDEQNFFITRLEDLVEIGMPLALTSYPDKQYPFEVFTFLNDIEIHCICTQEDLDRCELNLPLVEVED